MTPVVLFLGLLSLALLSFYLFLLQSSYYSNLSQSSSLFLSLFVFGNKSNKKKKKNQGSLIPVISEDVPSL